MKRMRSPPKHDSEALKACAAAQDLAEKEGALQAKVQLMVSRRA